MRTEEKLFDERGQFLGWDDEGLSEQRENFVRARFGEDDCFGFEDIEDIARRVRDNPEKPPDERIWKRVLDGGRLKAIPSFKLHDLRRFGLELGDSLSPGVYSEENGLSWLMPVLLGLSRNTEIYITMSSIMIIVKDSRGNDMVFRFWDYSNKGHSGQLERAVYDSDVIESAFLSWRDGNTHSGDYLLGRLRAAITDVSCEARRDFDKAVALSENGRSIVSADEVWVQVTAGPKLKMRREFLGSRKIFHDSIERRTFSRKMTPIQIGVKEGGFGHIECPILAIYQNMRALVTLEEHVPKDLLEEAKASL